MKSKEALERLKEETQPNAYTLNHNDEDFAIIEQDLDRLEKLEKAIELLKKYVGFKLVIDPIDSVRGIEAKYEYSDISKKEYELLKEVLEDDK